MNFLKNVITQFQKRYVYDATLKENNEFINNTIEHSTVEQNSTIEHSTRTLQQNSNRVEAVTITQSFHNGSENDNSVGDEFSNKKSIVEINKENIINISDNEEPLKVFDEFIAFHNDDINTLVQNTKHDSETELTLRKEDENCMLEINDFEEVLKEFMINRDDILPKCGDMVDYITDLNIINEEQILDDFGNFFDTSNDLEESEISKKNRDTKSMPEEYNTSDINKTQLLKLRHVIKTKKLSDNEPSTPSGLLTTEYNEVHEMQFKNTNKVEHFEVQSDEIQSLTLGVNTSIVVDLTVKEHNRFEIDDKIDETQDLINAIQNTGKLIQGSDHTKTVSKRDDHIIECNSGNKISKLGKENITIDYVDERDNNITATSDNGPTDIETISLLSVEVDMDDDDLDLCNGYHSSDFEFITESDAEINGLITNTSKSAEIKKKSKTKHVVTSKNTSSNEVKPGCSKDFKDKYNINEHCSTQSSRSSHSIPQGEEYLKLFQGIYSPMFNDLFFWENKSVRAQTCMNVQYEGVGFDIRMPSREDTNEECKYRILYLLHNKLEIF